MNNILKYDPAHPTRSAPIGVVNRTRPRHNLGSWIEDQDDETMSIALCTFFVNSGKIANVALWIKKMMPLMSVA
jgi:hypothetical protein